jgi:hypothetical protein
VFENLIFFNKKKIDQYTAYMLGKKVEGNTQANYLLECEQFEKLLRERDDYIDFTSGNQEVRIKDVRISSIIKVIGEIYVPEQFDMIQLMDLYKPCFIKDVHAKEEEEQEILNLALKNAKMKIPIFCELGSECDYWMGIGKAEQENLQIHYEELEDYEGKDVTIIARLDSRRYYKDKPLVVFDIYKDFLGFNRELRKQVSSEMKEEFEVVNVKEDYLGLELLAVY